MKRHLILLLCISFLYAFVFGAAVSADDSKTVKVGIYENQPKIFTDEKGNASGFWPDIVEYIATEEGWTIEYIPGTWEQCLNRLKNGELDIMPDVAYTEERSDLYDFSTETVYVSWSRIYTRKGIDIQSVLDLDGKNIAVLRGSINVEGPEGIKKLVSAFDLNCTFTEVDSYTMVFELVGRGEVDAGITNRDFGNRYEADYDVVKTSVIFQPALLYFAFPEGSGLTPHYIDRIDYHVKKLKADKGSVYYRSLERWLGVKPLEKPVIPEWVIWVLACIMGLVILFAGGSYILRSQVKDRTRQLTAEITRRKLDEERIYILNSMLRALRNVNQLITREPDKERLIQQSCQLIIQARGFAVAWILLFDSKKRHLFSAVEGDENVKAASMDQLKRGNYPVCVDRILEQKEPFAVCDDIITGDPDCPPKNLSGEWTGFIGRLQYEEKIYGVLSVYIPRDMAYDPEEQSLFRELAGDISFALAAIEKREEIKMLARFPGESPSPVLRVARNGTILYANKAGSPLLENWDKEVGQVLDRHWHEYILEALGTGAIRVLEVSCDSRIFLLHFTPVIEAEYVNIYGLEITEHKQAEEALRESEEKCRAIFEAATDGVLLADIDTKKFYDGNEAICRMTGYSIEELKNLGLKDIHPDEDLPYVIKMFENQTMGKFSLILDIPVKRKDGSVFYADINSAPVTFHKKTYLMGMFRDATERRRIEGELRKLSQAVEQSPAIVMITDLEGNVEYVNPKFENITGYTCKEMVGRSADSLGTPSAKETEQMWAALKSGKEWKGEFYNRKKNEEFYWEYAHIAPVSDRNGNITHFIKVAEDITERKQMEEKLIVTDRLASVGELASGIAHELNNPLTSVIGFSEMLLKKDISDDIREDLGIIFSEAQRASQVVKNLLTFARKHPTLKRMVNINEVVQKVLELRAYEEKVSNIQIIHNFTNELPATNADYFQLQQVFLNIIINAEQAMIEAHGRGKLTITTETTGNLIRVSITDDGPGISPQNLTRIFDPFFTTKEVGKGTGLGLSICYGIISAHGGQIYAESNHGKGATFIVELPVKCEHTGVE